MLKRFVILWLLALGFVLNTSSAQAGGSYTDALQLVKDGRFGLALTQFLQLAETGHAPSQFSVGLIYHLGRGTDVDLERAYYWYKRSVMNDHPPGLNNIGIMYLNGEYVVKNHVVAFRLFQKASTTHAQAMDNLAQCFENGWGTKRNIKRAISMYALSGERGFVAGWYHLGQLYEQDYPGYPQNIEKAVEWYIKAGEKKHNYALLRLKRMGKLPPELAQ
ncbi:MAG: sel1 repeat family protein [Magnetovibrio sp.]|nr:sel1 repeat family protein [Magnetovibrio sp.]